MYLLSKLLYLITIVIIKLIHLIIRENVSLLIYLKLLLIYLGIWKLLNIIIINIYLRILMRLLTLISYRLNNFIERWANSRSLFPIWIIILHCLKLFSFSLDLFYSFSLFFLFFLFNLLVPQGQVIFFRFLMLVRYRIWFKV